MTSDLLDAMVGDINRGGGPQFKIDWARFHITDIRTYARREPGAAKKLQVKRGSDNGRAKLTADQVREIRTKCGQRGSLTSVAKEYGLSQPTVWAIHHRKTWAHI